MGRDCRPDHSRHRDVPVCRLDRADDVGLERMTRDHQEEQIMKAREKVTLFVALAICMLGWLGAADAQSLRKISIAEPGKLFLYIPLYYAIDRGYFAKEGLAVEMLTAGRRDLAMTAVIAGEAFASVHDPVEVALARSRGATVKIIAPV